MLEPGCCGSGWNNGACNSVCCEIVVGRLIVLVAYTLTIWILDCKIYGMGIKLLVRALGSSEDFGTHTWPSFCCWCICAAL